ncbi:hypothetical protein KC331_g3654 [Hortaea werneckii]|nr:hypothetical protein KC361_g9398 [Hortaea werneckii]KAI6816909.1 hypothetical protein KC342_g15264 [Hortaea werneckii]KAI6853618.1 hypothetical protein KC323_g9261 [Hortaea werneckii]KAI6854581.1 hypothetical protein KC338_g9223 [Hortaea werneckii]KAI7059238.1 hypothetical protein KC339_g17409 [Hortaea werneckii]
MEDDKENPSATGRDIVHLLTDRDRSVDHAKTPIDDHHCNLSASSFSPVPAKVVVCFPRQQKAQWPAAPGG